MLGQLSSPSYDLINNTVIAARIEWVSGPGTKAFRTGREADLELIYGAVLKTVSTVTRVAAMVPAT